MTGGRVHPPVSQTWATAGRIVAFSGAHGCGKTTAAYAEAARLKRILPHDVGLVVETARFCPFPLNKDTSLSSQLWVTAAQVKAELEFAAVYETVVSDRCALDAAAYARVAGMPELAAAVEEVFRQHAHVYRAIHFMRGTPEMLCADGFRDTDPEFRAEVERALFDAYGRLGWRRDSRFILH